jgi:SAM-dependent methyltransferase
LKNGNTYVHNGAGRICPVEWINFDVSPILRIQKIPLGGKWFAKKAQGFNFPDTLRFGDIVKRLPVRENSCKGGFCAHVLEHLTRENAEKAIVNNYRILQPGGVFWCQLPDLKIYEEKYLNRAKEGNVDAADLFMREVSLGAEDRHDGWRGPLWRTFGNYLHLWM